MALDIFAVKTFSRMRGKEKGVTMVCADDSKLSGRGEADLKAIVSQTNDWLKDAKAMCRDIEQVAIDAMSYEEEFMPDWDNYDPFDEHDYTHIHSFGTLGEIQTRLGELTHELWKIGVRLELIHDLL